MRGVDLSRASLFSPLPQGQPFSFDAQRPALSARGLSEAENELNGLLRQELNVVVAFPHRGEALRQQQLLRRASAHLLEPGETPEGLAFAIAPARRGFVWRDLGLALLPDTQVFRKRPPRAPSRRDVRFRASPTCAPATTSCTRTTASPSCSASRRGGRGRHARLPAARLPRRRPRLRPARADRQGQPVHRRRRESAHALEARRQGLGQPEDARARARARAGRRPPPAVRPAPDPARCRVRPRPRMA